MRNLSGNTWKDMIGCGQRSCLDTLPAGGGNYRPAGRGTGQPGLGLRAAKAPFLRIGIGLSRTRRGAATVRAISCLPALVGAFGKTGGGALLSVRTTFDLSLLTRPDLCPRPVRELNMNQLGRILTFPLEPPVKSLYVYSSNPAAVLPDQNRVLAGLAREDLFTVVHERFLTDTALYADVVLPATSSLEQDDLYQSYGHYYLQLAKRVLSPLGEARSNWQVFSAWPGPLISERRFFLDGRRSH